MSKTLIVCRNDEHAASIRSNGYCGPKVAVINCGSLAEICLASPQHIIVCDDIDLEADVAGEGPLLQLLKKRQQLWGDKASLVVL